MKNNIFIPKTIKVGYQKRDDTYTKKLSYVIYYDEKGKLRKETSWNGWIDQKIEPQEFSNEPTTGFVLNKKVGDYKSDWNHRKAYIRVYDPRDFEFEITVENLLYILENANSIKGKGLEGEFVYGWDGKDLVLIPVDSPDYSEIASYNTLVHSKNFIKAKDLIIGATYRSKQNEEFVYMGRFDYWDKKYEYEKDQYGRDIHYKGNTKISDINKGKYYYFYNLNKQYDDFDSFKSLGDKFIEVIDSNCISNYAELFDKLECKNYYSPIDSSKDEWINYSFEEFEKQIKKENFYYKDVFDSNKNKVTVYKDCYYNNNDRINYRRIPYSTVQELFNVLQPMYKKIYLKNGKLYKIEGKQNG